MNFENWKWSPIITWMLMFNHQQALLKNKPCIFVNCLNGFAINSIGFPTEINNNSNDRLQYVLGHMDKWLLRQN